MMLEERWQTFTTANVSATPAPDGARLVRLEDLCALSFEGPDVAGFLQGYLTCDTTILHQDQLQPAALCNLKGRVLAFGWCLSPAANQILWLVPADLVSELQKFLKPYLAFSKTRLRELADDHLLIGCLETPGNIADDVSIRLITSIEGLDALCAGSSPVARGDFDVALIQAGIPWITSATSGEFLPQMLGLTALGAINFDKGCYLGQEVVARAQHRGQVKRRLTLLQQQADQSATPGATLLDRAGRAAGQVVASASSTSASVSLAVLQNDSEGPFEERDTGLSLQS
jgi:hypothetical protein